MVKRKVGNSHTTISITWVDKEQFRKFAKLVKKTKNGDMYESDSIIFHKILENYQSNNEVSSISHTTYPVKVSLTHVQQD